jgi:hypothetical protein
MQPRRPACLMSTRSQAPAGAQACPWRPFFTARIGELAF